MVEPHIHNGTDSPKLTGEAIEGAPAQALTAKSTATAGATYTSTEQGIINNTKTRLDELEARLQALSILK